MQRGRVGDTGSRRDTDWSNSLAGAAVALPCRQNWRWLRLRRTLSGSRPVSGSCDRRWRMSRSRRELRQEPVACLLCFVYPRPLRGTVLRLERDGQMTKQHMSTPAPLPDTAFDGLSWIARKMFRSGLTGGRQDCFSRGLFSFVLRRKSPLVSERLGCCYCMLPVYPEM